MSETTYLLTLQHHHQAVQLSRRQGHCAALSLRCYRLPTAHLARLAYHLAAVADHTAEVADHTAEMGRRVLRTAGEAVPTAVAAVRILVVAAALHSPVVHNHILQEEVYRTDQEEDWDQTIQREEERHTEKASVHKGRQGEQGGQGDPEEVRSLNRWEAAEVPADAPKLSEAAFHAY